MFGIIAGLGVLFSSVWFLAVVGLSLFLYEVWHRTISIREACIKALLFGVTYGAFSLWWLWHVLPMPGIEASIGIQGIVIGLLWAVCALLCGLSFALVATPLYLLRMQVVASSGAVVLLVFSEYVRMWLFGILALGPGSLMGAHFSQTSVGYVLTESSLLPIAKFGGVWMLSAVVVLIAGTIALGMRSIQEKRGVPSLYVALASCALVLGSCVYVGSRIPTALPHPLSVVVVGGHSTEGGEELLKRISDTETDVDLIVMPEGDRFHTSDDELTLLVSERVLVVSSHHPRIEDTYVSELTYQWSDTGTVARYQKQFLMPQGEYTPYIASALYAFITEVGGPTFESPHIPRLVPGDTFASVSLGDTIVGGLICSDLLSPELYPRLVRATGAKVLLNLTNPNWLNGSRLYDAKMRQMAQVHAVHTGAYMLVSSLDTPAFIVSPTGAVRTAPDAGEYVTAVLGN